MQGLLFQPILAALLFLFGSWRKISQDRGYGFIQGFLYIFGWLVDFLITNTFPDKLLGFGIYNINDQGTVFIFLHVVSGITRCTHAATPGVGTVVTAISIIIGIGCNRFFVFENGCCMNQQVAIGSFLEIPFRHFPADRIIDAVLI